MRTFKGMKDVSFDYMEPEKEERVYDLLQHYQSKSSSGKAAEYQKLIELSEDGNKFTV